MAERSERNGGLFQKLDALLVEIIDQFASQGHGTAFVIATMQDVLAKRKEACERDPDPAEDDVDEPVNDWPGADRRSAATKE
ncbi:hypothetical protein [Ensifer canadensis]